MILKLQISRISILCALLMCAIYGTPHAGSTIILSTTTYSTADEDGESPVALPKAGVYYFDMVVTSSGTAFTTVSVYLQQRGIASGVYYTIYNSTFTTCTGPCTRFVVPDMYLGGDVRARWTVGGASVTIKVTARAVDP